MPAFDNLRLVSILAVHTCMILVNYKIILMVLGVKKFHFTDEDFKLVSKECECLQLPAYEVKITECIGEGLFIM